MAVRGVYSPEEKKMLEQWRTAPQTIGWLGEKPIAWKVSYPVYHRVASKT